MSSIGVQVLHESGCYSDACLQQGDAWFMDETLSHEDAKKVVWHTFKWLKYETSSKHLQITTRYLSLSNHHIFIWIQVLWKRAQLVTGRLWQVDLPDQQVSRTEGEEQTFCFTGVFLDGDEIFRWDEFEMTFFQIACYYRWIRNETISKWHKCVVAKEFAQVIWTYRVGNIDTNFIDGETIRREPVDRYVVPWFTGFCTSKVIQEYSGLLPPKVGVDSWYFLDVIRRVSWDRYPPINGLHGTSHAKHFVLALRTMAKYVLDVPEYFSCHIALNPLSAYKQLGRSTCKA